MPALGDRRLPERFWRHVAVGENGCWNWQHRLNNQNYGIVWDFGPRRNRDWRTDYAHRVVYQALVAEIPVGHEIDHLCRVRHCVNPDHLEAVTHAENMRRMRKSHCKRGHELVPENLYVRKDTGVATCHTCRKLRDFARTETAKRAARQSVQMEVAA